MNELGKAEVDKLFCLCGKKYRLPKLLIKAVGVFESGLNQTAYRFEPAFFTKYLKNKPEWKDRDPSEVSASYGVMQLMFTTAVSLGYRGTGEELYNPVINIELGAKLLRKLLDKVLADKQFETFPWLSPISIALSWYNGGTTKNPDEKGNLRNEKYAIRVLKEWQNLKTKERECDE